MSSLSLSQPLSINHYISDEAILRDNQITLNSKECAIIYNKRKISYNITKQIDNKWVTVTLDEVQMRNVATKIAVMLFHKNVLQKNNPSPLNASITSEGIVI